MFHPLELKIAALAAICRSLPLSEMARMRDRSTLSPKQPEEFFTESYTNTKPRLWLQHRKEFQYEAELIYRER